MTTLALSDRSLDRLKADALVIGLGSNDDGLVLLPGAETIDESLGGALVAALQTLGATGKQGDCLKLVTFGQATVPLIIAVGLGSPGTDGYTSDQVRRAAGCAARALSGQGTAITTLAGVNGNTDAQFIGAAAEGIMLGGYTYAAYKSTAPDAASSPLARSRF